MKFATLYKINELLEADCFKKQEAEKAAREALSKFEDVHELSWQHRDRMNSVPEKIREEYKDLLENKGIASSEFEEAKDALDDFQSHDWH